MKPVNWPLVGFFALLISTILAGTALPPDDRICEATLLGKSAKEANTLVFGCLEFWVNRYQTLIAAMLAVLAAGVSVHFLRRQIAQAEQHEQERYAREHAAARAVLQLTLSGICRYAEQSGRRLFGELPNEAGITRREGRGRAPAVPLPDQPIEQLRDFIASVDARRSAIVAQLISEIQVHHARTAADEGNFFRRSVSRTNVIEYIIDAAEIYARAAMLFDYARRETDEFPGPPKQENMSNALFSIDLRLRHEDEIMTIINRRYPAD